MTIENEALDICTSDLCNGRTCYQCERIAKALQKKQARIDELESALKEIHRLCRTLEPLDATIRIIEVKEKAIGGGND